MGQKESSVLADTAFEYFFIHWPNHLPEYKLWMKFCLSAVKQIYFY